MLMTSRYSNHDDSKAWRNLVQDPSQSSALLITPLRFPALQHSKTKLQRSSQARLLFINGDDVSFVLHRLM